MSYEQLVEQVKEHYENGEGQPWALGLTNKQFVELYHSMELFTGAPPRHDADTHRWLVQTPYGIVYVQNGRSIPLHEKYLGDDI